MSYWIFQVTFQLHEEYHFRAIINIYMTWRLSTYIIIGDKWMMGTYLYLIYNGAHDGGGESLLKMNTCPTRFPKKKRCMLKDYFSQQTCEKRKRKQMWKGRGITSVEGGYGGWRWQYGAKVATWHRWGHGGWSWGTHDHVHEHICKWWVHKDIGGI